MLSAGVEKATNLPLPAIEGSPAESFAPGPPPLARETEDHPLPLPVIDVGVERGGDRASQVGRAGLEGDEAGRVR